jgi:raffinose/stachyose/melibiose transport system permease protein
LAPGIGLVGAFILIPVLHTAYLSLFRWDGTSPGTFVGIANYLRVATDPALLQLFLHSAQLVFFYAVLPILFGLLVTAVFARREVRGMGIYRAALFLPQVVSLVVVAVAWQWVYAQDGIANQLLRVLGIDSRTAWLGDFTWALPALGLVGSWLMTGLCVALVLSGVQKIDPSLFEAARLDGANAFREFLHITLPELRSEIGVALTLTVVAALRSFDLVYLLTRGGPGTSTAVPGYEIFARAFTRGEVGSAASLGVVLTLVIVLTAYLIDRVSADRDAS